jgi:hypothetical protein
MEPVAMNATSATAKQVHDDIEQAFEAPPERVRKRAERFEEKLKSGGAAVWRVMKRHPFLAMAAIAVGGVAAASTVGAAEIWFGGALAFAAYKVLREGEPPMRVLQRLGKDL